MWSGGVRRWDGIKVDEADYNVQTGRRTDQVTCFFLIPPPPPHKRPAHQHPRNINDQPYRTRRIQQNRLLFLKKSIDVNLYFIL